jgi:plasmid maintenance system antidote protein VapI
MHVVHHSYQERRADSMTDTKLLERAIEDSGLKKGFLAEKLGVSRQTMTSLLNGQTEFKASQINTLTALLQLTAERRDAIFFAKAGA